MKRCKTISLLLVIFLLLPLAALAGCGEIEYAVVSEANISAEGLIYTLYEDGSAVITGVVSVEDGRLTVPESLDSHKVSGIAASAFAGLENLYYVKLVNFTGKIAESAFSGCTYLSYADLGTPSEIGNSAFYNCLRLTLVKGTDSARNVGSYAFCGCASLTEFAFSEKLESIGESAFENCASLACVTLPASLKSLGENVFAYCSALAYADMGTYRNIPAGCFEKCEALSYIVFSSKTESIGELAFRSCTSLYTLNLPKSLKTVNADAFADCSALSVVNYTGSEKNWNKTDFTSGNEALTGLRPYTGYKGASANDSGSYTVYTSRGEYSGSYTSGVWNYALYEDGTAALTGITGAVTALEIPAAVDGHSVVTLAEASFQDNTSLVSVSLGSTLERVDNAAFYGCTALSSVSGGEGLKQLGYNAFTGTKWLNEQIADYVTLGSVLVTYRGSDTAAVLPEGIGYIGDGAFTNNERISCVLLGKAVVHVGNQAFAFCESLRHIYGPSVETVGEYAFAGCDSLTVFDMSEKIKSFGRYAFADCNSMKYVCPGKCVSEMKDTLFADCVSLRIFDMPASLTYLYSGIFYGCTSFIVLYPGTEAEYTAACQEDGSFYMSDQFVIYGDSQ